MGKKDVREFGSFRLDADRKVLWRNDERVPLAQKEIELLCVLTEKSGEVMTKAELLDSVWADSFVEESNLTNHIYRIRKALKDLGHDGEIIETVPRVGYRFAGQVRDVGDDDIIIERRSISQTVIEQVDDTPRSAARRWFYPVVFAVTVIGLLAGGLVYYRASSYADRRLESIAVVPFIELDRDGANRFRGVAFADLIITRLSSIREISVRPTSSVMQFDGATPDVAAVADSLTVDGVIEGTISEVDGDLRVTVRLVRASDRSTVWSEHFVRPSSDELDLQNDLALQIVDALALNLSTGEQRAVGKRYTESDNAMRLYLKGRYHWNKRSNEGITEAQRLFRNAIAEDPNFALAYVGLADTWIFASPVDGEAIAAVDRALELDPSLGEAYATRGFIRMFHQWRWDDADADFRRAIELNPGYSTAHQWYATLLMIRGRQDQAIDRLHEALRINPVSHNLYGDLCQAEYYARRYADAERSCGTALGLFPDFSYVRGWLSSIYFATGRPEEAVRESSVLVAALATLSVQTETDRASVVAVAHSQNDLFRDRGIEGYWRTLLDASDDRLDSNGFIARARAALELGDRDRALRDLSVAISRRAFLAPYLNADPAFDRLRGDRRFMELLARMELP